MQKTVARLVQSKGFQRTIIALILANGIVIGLETSKAVAAYAGGTLLLINEVILWLFVAEVVVKLWVEWPRPGRYFSDGWNIFDFVLVGIAP